MTLPLQVPCAVLLELFEMPIEPPESLVRKGVLKRQVPHESVGDPIGAQPIIQPHQAMQKLGGFWETL